MRFDSKQKDMAKTYKQLNDPILFFFFKKSSYPSVFSAIVIDTVLNSAFGFNKKPNQKKTNPKFQMIKMTHINNCILNTA